MNKSSLVKLLEQLPEEFTCEAVQVYNNAEEEVTNIEVVELCKTRYEVTYFGNKSASICEYVVDFPYRPSSNTKFIEYTGTPYKVLRLS